jgi:hypothetical protein
MKCVDIELEYTILQEYEMIARLKLQGNHAPNAHVSSTTNNVVVGNTSFSNPTSTLMGRMTSSEEDEAFLQQLYAIQQRSDSTIEEKHDEIKTLLIALHTPEYYKSAKKASSSKKPTTPRTDTTVLQNAATLEQVHVVSIAASSFVEELERDELVKDETTNQAQTVKEGGEDNEDDDEGLLFVTPSGGNTPTSSDSVEGEDDDEQGAEILLIQTERFAQWEASIRANSNPSFLDNLGNAITYRITRKHILQKHLLIIETLKSMVRHGRHHHHHHDVVHDLSAHVLSGLSLNATSPGNGTTTSDSMKSTSTESSSTYSEKRQDVPYLQHRLVSISIEEQVQLWASTVWRHAITRTYLRLSNNVTVVEDARREDGEGVDVGLSATEEADRHALYHYLVSLGHLCSRA